MNKNPNNRHRQTCPDTPPTYKQNTNTQKVARVANNCCCIPPVTKLNAFFCVPVVLKLTSYFDGQILSYHAVSGCQISVDKLLGVQVSHAVCDLSSHLDHLLQSGRWKPGVVLWDTRYKVQILNFWSANTEIHNLFSVTHDLIWILIPNKEK